MSRKTTYIHEWRKKKGYTLAQMVGRLAELGVNKTEASLSRIERGIQPYSEPILEALAEALEVEAWQLLRDNPFKEGEVVDFVWHLSEREQAQAMDVLRAMFKRDAG